MLSLFEAIALIIFITFCLVILVRYVRWEQLHFDVQLESRRPEAAQRTMTNAGRPALTAAPATKTQPAIKPSPSPRSATTVTASAQDLPSQPNSTGRRALADRRPAIQRQDLLALTRGRQ